MKIRLATIIDCEGSIGIWKNRDKYKEKIFYYLKPIVAVGQKNKEYLKQFLNAFGFGRIGKCGPNSNYHQYTACFIQALIICIVLYEYLQLKKNDAKTIIEHYYLKSNGKNYHFNKKLNRYGFTEIFIKRQMEIILKKRLDSHG